jgi:hypothetical protein
MSVSFMLFCLCWIIFSLISFEVGLGNMNTAISIYAASFIVN